MLRAINKGLTRQILKPSCLINQFDHAKRNASQLYPVTSQRLDNAMTQAESMIGDCSNFSNLNKWVSGEFNNIAKYLQRLVGTNHPMLETAKRCAYISEGRMGSAQARGLIVILAAKAVEQMPKSNYTEGKRIRTELIKDQISLAEMAEITYSAYMIHRGVVDLKLHGLEDVIQDNVMMDLKAKGLHYGNKVSILCGDLLLAYVMRGLGDLFSSKAVDLVASAITDFMEGEFILIDDWKSINYLQSNNSRDLERWAARTYASIGSLQGKTCQSALVLANVKESLQNDINKFGTNLGFAWQAHTELQPFLKSEYEPIELAELPSYPAFDLNCLPVMLFLRQSYETNKNFRLLIDDIKSISTKPTSQHIHQEVVDYRRLHELTIKQGFPVEETFRMIRKYSETAIGHLKSLPPSEAKDVLENICVSLYER